MKHENIEICAKGFGIGVVSDEIVTIARTEIGTLYALQDAKKSWDRAKVGMEKKGYTLRKPLLEINIVAKKNGFLVRDCAIIWEHPEFGEKRTFFKRAHGTVYVPLTSEKYTKKINEIGKSISKTVSEVHQERKLMQKEIEEERLKAEYWKGYNARKEEEEEEEGEQDEYED